MNSRGEEGGEFRIVKNKKKRTHGSVKISFRCVFRHLHSNLYLGEEFCLKTTYSNLKPLVTKFHLYIDAQILQRKPHGQICTQANYVYKS